MRLFRIVSLHLQNIFHHRLRSFVWFLIPLMNNLTVILFWSGAIKNTSQNAAWTMSTITTYYFLLTIINSMLNSYIQEDVAEFDIKQGDLVRYLTRPFPYYWIKFIEEIPYRILQGSYGIILIIIFSFFYKNYIIISNKPIIILLSIPIMILALFLSFTLKMNLGLSAFWFKDSRSFFELVTIIIIIFSGGVMPLFLLPQGLQTISSILPFAYTAYFPILSLQGNLSYIQLIRVIGIQCLWLAVFIAINRIMWKYGIKQFTSFGQ
ncbi:hypothetical protein COY87_00095 [Candidatus Roizmanbacteria bacterium CG_4_10_14_0_8_um_filter_33_9]|uniref:ABC transporter permease n=1 Tax=Candidatus Roizmanbacteria bacterium CG_4_10_14_0_8_um_filter_33_9 TaxID=1974826 RepID=A0A2M7QJT0_9BACT|nr:MAG: hypothetical protein COY87_00095 [Candidatus Roizmanbacteria bacterium CG_4_10_14_0_8_um_filter_33_9]